MSLRHAFEIDDYPIGGELTGEFHLTGEYERPVGFGAMTIDDGVAYGEPFQEATSALRFDGNGVRLDGVSIAKGGGTISGAAYVGWDSTYSFNADARRIPVEAMALLNYATVQPSGLIDFTSGGSGLFDVPRYDVRFRVDDLLAAGETVGQVTGTLAVRGKELSGQVDAASPQLALTGTGRIALTPQADSELTFRFHDSSLDPYVRLFVPKLSPFTTAVASGSIRVVGELADVDHLLVDGTVDSLDMRLFDYTMRNEGAPIGWHARPAGRPLERSGARRRGHAPPGRRHHRAARQSHCAASRRRRGPADSQGFFRDVRGSGRAELLAAINGSIDDPIFSGSATITDGRIRHFSLPNALDAINGTIHFDSRGVRLDDRDGDDGRGHVAVRRPHRLRRLSARRSERHRAGRGHAPADSGGHPLDGRRRSDARGNVERAGSSAP